MLDDDLRCVADPSEPGEAIREVFVLRERVPGQLFVEANRRGGLPARAHEAALHELDVAWPLGIPQVPGIAVPGERAFPAPAEKKSTERRERTKATVIIGLDDLSGRSDHTPVVVDLLELRKEPGRDAHVVVEEDHDVARGIVDAEVALTGQAGRGPVVANRTREGFVETP